MSFQTKTAGRGLIGCLTICALLGSAPTLAGCLGAGDDNSTPVPIVDGSSDAKGGEAGIGDAHAGDAGDAASQPPQTDATIQEGGNSSASPPAASLSATSIQFGPVGCGAPATTKTLVISNTGGSTLVVSASTVGTAFSVNPTSVQVPPAGTGNLVVTATVPAASAAGTAISGSLSLFTNDPSNSSSVLLLSVTPTGASLTGISNYAFASSELMVPAQPLGIQLSNTGNAPGTFTFGAPSKPSFSLAGLPPGGAVTLNPGDTVSGTATFTPSTASPVQATVSIVPPAGACGASISTLTLSGTGTTGRISGFPTVPIDFGNVGCGASAPAPQHITLNNTSLTTDTEITSVDVSGIGSFTTDVAAGSKIPAGGSLVINFTAPAGPVNPTSLAPITGKIVVKTDADTVTTGTTITVTEEPRGAVLAFSSPSTAGCTTSAMLGSFGSVGNLLQTVPPQNFCIVNTGNAPANVILDVLQGVMLSDGGVDGSVDGGVDSGDDGGGDATAAQAMPFVLTAPSFMIAATSTPTTPSVEQESLSFTPMQAGTTSGALEIGVDPASVLCAPLPSPQPLSGSALGAGPTISTSALTFQATCGGQAPATGTVTVGNGASATADLNWTLSGPNGPGAAQFTVSAAPTPGLLQPGAQATITVTGAALSSPVLNPDPAALTAQLTITTDVPFDPPHVITLTEVPIGDQLFVTVPDQLGSTLRFGQVPASTSVNRTFTVTNNANAPSASANLTLTVSGAGAAAYGQPTQVSGNLGPGGSATESVGFDEATVGSYPASITFSTTDTDLCTPLPGPIALTGAATAGSLQLSASTLYFGTNPTDANVANRSLVNCGTTGTTQTLTVTNAGSQALNLLTLTLGHGATSPFAITSPPTLPFLLAIGASTTLTLTPSAIPAMGVDPTIATTYSDTLQITTDVAGETVPPIALLMQPRGAVITSTPPPTTWNFGMVSAGSIGTFVGTTLQNAGNIPATVTLSPATTNPSSLPTVFGLENNPVTVPAGAETGLVGEFNPNAPNASWSGEGILTVTADAFCAPLPTAWNMPEVAFSGTSNSNPAVAASGSLVFPTTDCGGAPPGGQSVTLTNFSNQQYAYTVSFFSGAFYTFADGGSGKLPANNTATIVVNPKLIVPGPGVLPGSAPYADDLIVTIATVPPTTFTEPISWTLNGAVLSLPFGAGPFGPVGGTFYVADTGGVQLPMQNKGTATASVQLAVQPLGAFALQGGSVNLLPNIPAFPVLASNGSAPVCSAPANGTATFLYSGPVCQPFSTSSVTVDFCSGTYGACFSPEIACGGACVNSQTDNNNCGGCGVACTAPTSCVGGGCACPGNEVLSNGICCPANMATNCGGTCTDTTSDVNNCGGCGAAFTCTAGDACVASVCKAPALVPCVELNAASPPEPIGAAGQLNCVQCTAIPANLGVCTATEQLIVNRDIGKNLLVSGQLDPDNSCYACAAASACIDTGIHRTKNCEDLTGTVGTGAAASKTNAQLCLDVLACILGDPQQDGYTWTNNGSFVSCANDPSPGDGITNCYCGSNFPTVPLCNGATAAGVNGACEAVILDGLGDVEPSGSSPTPPATVLTDNTTPTLAAGRADAFLKCAGTNAATAQCPQCYQ